MAYQKINIENTGQQLVDKLDNNFTELSTMLNNITQSLSVTNAKVTALQEEATAKWMLLNTVDNRSRSNENRITAIENI